MFVKVARIAGQPAEPARPVLTAGLTEPAPLAHLPSGPFFL